MQILKDHELRLIKGGLNLDDSRLSNNVLDTRNPSYWSANNGCLPPGTPDSAMWPNKNPSTTDTPTSSEDGDG